MLYNNSILKICYSILIFVNILSILLDLGCDMIKKPLVCAICSAFAMSAMAETEDEPNVVLDALVATLQDTQSNSGFVFKDSKKASDTTVSKAKLKHRSATLGNALSDELGVHSNPFGGGASAPVIRGQDGVRVKILQNGTDVIDVSSMSPDHVVAADTLLAERVELVRGAPTLLYSTASMAGVVNVVDGRIPTKMPNGLTHERLEGEVLIRHNTASDEKVVTAGVSAALTDKIAVRFEGLKRHANDYDVPEFQSDVKLDYLPDSYNKSTVGTFGVSWIDDKGYLGASYSRRKDRYGIPGHNHHYDACRAHFIDWDGNIENGTGGRYYLPAYPHLMDDLDIIDYPHFDNCRAGSYGDDHGHSHDNPFGFDHKHEHGGPWVNMTSDRYDVKGEWRQPILGLDKIKLSLTHADYFHDEKDPANPDKVTANGGNSHLDRGHPAAVFKNKGLNSRLEFFHTPTKRWKGVFGVQYAKQKSHAITPYLPSDGAGAGADPRHLLAPNTNDALSVFGLEQYRLGKVTLEMAGRYETQKTTITYEHDLLARKLEIHQKNQHGILGDANKPQHPDLSPYKQNAFSYSGTLLWDMTPKHRLSLTASHNERFPTPMELYYNGKHLATNSFEHGNKELTKERSNNYEVGMQYTGDKIDYKISAYHSNFNNYIFNENVDKVGNLYIRRYNQTTAKINGLEGEVTYHFNPEQSITLFGDVVRGKIGALKPVVGKLMHAGRKWVYFDDDIKEMTVDENGDYDDTSDLTCGAKTPEQWGQINPHNECSTTINVYKNGTTTPSAEDYDTLQRPATNAPRIPPARLGFRYKGAFGDHWSVNMDLSRVFKQNRVSTSTIVLKPAQYVPEGCDPSDKENCQRLDYYNPNNPLTLQARHVTEDVTKGYTVLDLGVDYDNIWKNVDYTLSLRANNLLNEKIYIHNSFLPYVPQMGRNVTLGLTVKF